ncbi:hypothetical protein FHR32_006188 [Streptosporangium album]|uniref:Uncharacterized protein n=1 Tax=Streptosporangium album TaxID=47479 RepID=A0A7W7WBQ6_9ACTN|nr:hypothetical protein [Streptosporangium album]
MNIRQAAGMTVQRRRAGQLAVMAALRTASSALPAPSL